MPSYVKKAVHSQRRKNKATIKLYLISGLYNLYYTLKVSKLYTHLVLKILLNTNLKMVAMVTNFF